MKLALCDDSVFDTNYTKNLILEACALLSLPAQLDCYSSGEALLQAVENGSVYPLVFLDIYMHFFNGIQTARKLRDLLPETQIAFLTSSREFTFDAFDLNALHYLLKPVSTDQIRECLLRFSERKHLPLSLLTLQAKAKTYSFPLHCVQKIVSSKKGIDVYLSGTSLPSPQHIAITFAEAEKQLDPSRFLKISRGFLVQMSFILGIQKDTCFLKDGTEMLLSRREKTYIRKKYNDYLFQNQFTTHFDTE